VRQSGEASECAGSSTPRPERAALSSRRLNLSSSPARFPVLEALESAGLEVSLLAQVARLGGSRRFLPRVYPRPDRDIE
jgi:hypothetical protein